MSVVPVDIVIEPVATVLLQPRPGDDASVLDPVPDLPLTLPALMLTESPGDIPHVPGRARPEQPPLLEGELLHPRNDLRRNSHRADNTHEPPAGRLRSVSFDSMPTLFSRKPPQDLEQRRAFIEGYRFPDSVREALRDEYDPELTPAQLSIVLDGLRTWFLALLHANGKALGMPSEAVDTAWHEFIIDARAYHSFCDHALGHYLHHAPAATMQEPLENAMRRTLAITRKHPAPQDLAAGGVPFLFAIDDLVGIEGGYSWTGDRVERLRNSEGPGGGCGGSCGGSCGGGCGGS